MNLFLPQFLKNNYKGSASNNLQAIQVRLERDLEKTEGILQQDTQSPVTVAEGRTSTVAQRGHCHRVSASIVPEVPKNAAASQTASNQHKLQVWMSRHDSRLSKSHQHFCPSPAETIKSKKGLQNRHASPGNVQTVSQSVIALCYSAGKSCAPGK